MKILAARVRNYASTLLSLTLLVLGSSRPASWATATSPQPDNCDLAFGQCFQFSINTEHFAVIYNTTGRFAVTREFANNVSIMAEAAYAKLVVEDGFTPPARNPIPIYLDLANAGFTSFLLCQVCTAKPSDLQRLQIEFRYRSPCPNYCGIPTSDWEVAHEVFHTIQFTQFDGTLPFGRWLAEGSANWAGYTVAKNESRWDPWVISEWLGPNGTTERSLDDRRYDNAFFFAFLSDHYGGPEIIKRIMSAANRETKALDVAVSQLKALGYHKTSAELMNEFATAILTGNFTDRNGAGAVLRSLPPIGAMAKWTGTNETVATFTGPANGFNAGDHLWVNLPDGFEYVRIEPDSNASLSVGLQAQNRSCFDATVVARQGDRFTTYKVGASSRAIVPSPDKYDRILVAVTKGSCASGDFSIVLGTVKPEAHGLVPSGTALAALLSALAIIVVLVAAFVFQRRRTRPGPGT